MEDKAIVGLYLDRDQRAIEETEKSHGAKLMRIAFGVLKNQEDAEETVNDTYLRAWDTIPPQIPQFLFAYLAKICRFLAFDRLDWQQAGKRNVPLVELTRELELCIPASHMEQAVEIREMGRLLTEFLNGLPREPRLIFMRRYWFGDSIREIAKRYHIGESKVKTSLHRTRNKLKRYLEKEEITL